MKALPILSLTLLLFFLGELELGAQSDKYWVHFTDKDHTPYSVQNPEAFLSQAAIDRRKKHGIPIDRKDLPVDPAYKDSILAHPSVEFLHSSRWFNAITVHCPDSLHMDTIGTISFVASTEKVRSYTIPYPSRPKKAETLQRSSTWEASDEWHGKVSPGKARKQLSMLGVDHLLELGYKGKGIRIGVLDAGFPNVKNMKAFSHLFKEGRYVGGFDAVKGDRYPFRAHAHGRAVLSILAARLENKMLGAAPKASYILCRTENGNYEYKVEEHNWIAAAEFADSAGADILSTSLGYTTFEDSTQDHTPSDMDGNTTMITKGADIAASRGILVVNSAGNYADRPWGTIGAPADGDSVLAIGSVDSNRNWSSFSSTGPSADGRTKPDLAAMGEGTAFLGGNGKVYRGNGTSFSAPLISGAAACLWSAFPNLGPMELGEILKKSGSHHQNPNNKVGHGIPNVYEAFLEEKGWRKKGESKAELLRVGPNPFRDRIELYLYAGPSRKVRITWYDRLGQKLRQEAHPLDPEHHHRISLNAPSRAHPSGLYFLELRWEGGKRKLIELVGKGGSP